MSSLVVYYVIKNCIKAVQNFVKTNFIDVSNFIDVNNVNKTAI